MIELTLSKKIFLYLCIFITILTILVGCTTSDSLNTYRDDQLGFSIEYPSSWRLEKNERLFGEVILEKEPSLLSDGSARISFSFAPAMIQDDFFLENTMLEGMAKNIENMVAEYGSDSTEIVSHPKTVPTSFGFIVVSIISIDTYALPDESEKNRTGFMDEDHEQIIAKYYFVDPENERFGLASVYYGVDEKINEQANQVINSLSFIEN